VIVLCTCGATLSPGQRCPTCEPRSELERVIVESVELAIASGLPLKRAIRKTAAIHLAARVAEKRGRS